MGKLVLVTGACGYSGRALVHTLINRGFSVRAADVAPRPDGDDSLDALSTLDVRADFVRCDVTSKEQVEAAVKGVEAVFHVAALVPYNHARTYSREHLFKVNVDGTKQLLQAAAAAGVKRFLYASSTGVVFRGDPIAGGNESLSIDEVTDQSALNDDYSASKAAAEKAVLEFSGGPSGMLCTALRPSGIWGPGGEAHHIPKLLRSAQLGVAPLMALGQDSLTDFCHVQNLCHAFMLAHDALASPGATTTTATAAAVGAGVTLPGASSSSSSSQAASSGSSTSAPAPGTATKADQVAGQAFFVSDGWPVHTLEFFSPLLSELGFQAPFPYKVVERGEGGINSERRVKTGRQLARLQERDTNTDPIIVTAPAFIPLPGWLIFPAAWLLEACSAVLRRVGIDTEPFLTRADSRKVVRHNYYSCKKAEDVLGYKPVVTPAKGLKATAEYYFKQGWDGYCPSPGVLPWLVAPTGIALTGALAYCSELQQGGLALLCRLLVAVSSLLSPTDAAGAAATVPAFGSAEQLSAVINGAISAAAGWSGFTSLHATLAAGTAGVVSAAGAFGEALLSSISPVGVLSGSTAGSGAFSSGGGTCSGGDSGGLDSFSGYGSLMGEGSCSSAAHSSFSPSLAAAVGSSSAAGLDPLSSLLACIFWAAVLAHCLQAVWAARAAWGWRMAAGAWALQTLALGFPSSSLLIAQAAGRGKKGASEQLAKRWPVYCVTMFCCCLPFVALLHAVGKGAGLLQ